MAQPASLVAIYGNIPENGETYRAEAAEESMSRRLLTSLLVVTGVLSVLGVLRAAATPTGTRHADITVSELAQLAEDNQVHSLEIRDDGWFVVGLDDGEEREGIASEDVVAVLERNGIDLEGVEVRR